MKYPTSHAELTQAYRRYLQIKEIERDQEEINAESSLVMIKGAREMKEEFRAATAFRSFVRKYGALINSSPRPIYDIEPEDILSSVANTGESLLLTDPTQLTDDTLWTNPGGGELSRPFFFPHPVDITRVQLRRGPDRFMQTENAVLAWRAAAVKIADAELEGFYLGMRERAFNVKAVIADDGGVTALLRFNSQLRNEWNEACRHTLDVMQAFGVANAVIRWRKIVALPDKPRKRGTILYLA